MSTLPSEPSRSQPTATMERAVAPRCAGRSALPCQEGDNSIEWYLERRKSIERAYRKNAFVLVENVKALCAKVGIERVGFLTLTFKEHLDFSVEEDWKEAQRRFNSLRSNVIAEMFGVNITVLEPQRTGRIHYHLLVECREDIRTGLNFEEIRKRNYRTANPYLRRLWRELRETLPKYGFGRSELLPIRSTKEAMGDYLGKYLAKSCDLDGATALSGRRFKGRKVRYSRGFRVAHCKFAWVEGGRLWRQAVAHVAGELGIASTEGFTARYGPNWAYFLGPAIIEAYEMACRDGE